MTKRYKYYARENSYDQGETKYIEAICDSGGWIIADAVHWQFADLIVALLNGHEEGEHAFRVARGEHRDVCSQKHFKDEMAKFFTG